MAESAPKPVTRVLVVEADPSIRNALVRTLHTAGLEPHAVTTDADALAALEDGRMDLILLDLGLPDADGNDVVTQLRKLSTIPIIIVSGEERESEKIAALEAGADDYIEKPFSPGDLVARVHAVMRRTGMTEPPPPVMIFGDVEIDLRRRRVSLRGALVHLTPTEYSLLEGLVTYPGKLLTHQWLLQRVWGPGYGVESNYLRTYVGQLREKLGDEAASPRLIVTETGIGYRWIAEPDRIDQRAVAKPAH